MSNSIWVVTCEKDCNQCAGIPNSFKVFLSWFKEKPTIDQLMKLSDNISKSNAEALVNKGYCFTFEGDYSLECIEEGINVDEED